MSQTEKDIEHVIWLLENVKQAHRDREQGGIARESGGGWNGWKV